MAPKLVVATQPSDPLDLVRDLSPTGFDITIAQFGSPDYRAALKEADYVIGFGDPAMNDDFFKSAPNLKLIQLMSAGYDRCDVEAARRAGVPISNNGGANAIAVAEHAMLSMMPSVLSCSSSKPAENGSLPRQRPAATLVCCQISRRETAIINSIACSATAMALAPPLLEIGTPARRAASTSQRS